MKKLISLLALAMTMSAMALVMPDGFVYRARCAAPTSTGELPATIDITLRLYETETAVMPSWTGLFQSVPLVTNGLFQIWVSEKSHASTAVGESGLESVLRSGKGAWLGVTFAQGRECKPRRMLVTSPLATEAAVAASLDDAASVNALQDCATLTAADATIDTLKCDTLILNQVSAGEFNLQTMKARSVTLSRDTGNRILSDTRSEWTKPVELKTGMAITNTLGRAAFLTVRSVSGSRTAPCLTVPVPAGQAFVWQAGNSTNIWQFTALGAE